MDTYFHRRWFPEFDSTLTLVSSNTALQVLRPVGLQLIFKVQDVSCILMQPRHCDAVVHGSPGLEVWLGDLSDLLDEHHTG